MRRLTHRLQSWWWNRLQPEWDLPDDLDDVSPAAFRQWVAGHKHPEQCNRGCQHDLGGGDTT